MCLLLTVTSLHVYAMRPCSCPILNPLSLRFHNGFPSQLWIPFPKALAAKKYTHSPPQKDQPPSFTKQETPPCSIPRSSNPLGFLLRQSSPLTPYCALPTPKLLPSLRLLVLHLSQRLLPHPTTSPGRPRSPRLFQDLPRNPSRRLTPAASSASSSCPSLPWRARAPRRARSAAPSTAPTA